jgi:beta-glucosidase
MTLDEKVQLVHGVQANFDVGEPGYKRDSGSLQGDGYVPAIPRLDLPALQIIGAGAGVTNLGRRANGQSTALPSPLAETATWNPALAFEFGAVIGRETRSQGFNVSIGGAINLAREPRDGRTFEYHGEDPLLAGAILGRELKAIQDQHLVATIKHFAVNDQETGRSEANSIIDRRSLHESDLLAFEIALHESNAGVVMCSYNRVNGDYSCENDYLLNQVLKRSWGFNGWVMSDWDGTHSTVKAATAGLDQEMNTGVYLSDGLRQAVEKGEVPLKRLDDMVHRILRTEFACGIVDHPPVIKPIDFPADRKIAQQVEEQAIVLLENSGVLPLKASDLREVAVIGSYAESGVLSGEGSAQVSPVGGNAVPVATYPTGGPLAVPVYDPSSPLQAIREKTPNTLVDYEPGGDIQTASHLAAISDVAIVFAHQRAAEGRDLPNLSLPDRQDELIREVAKANPHTIVVLETGGPVLMPWLDKVAAVVEAWYPGSGGGEAIARVLFGNVNPSGKLPVTFPRSENDLPRPAIPHPPMVGGSALTGPAGLFDVEYTEGNEVGYKWFDAENKPVLFPFGFGLSYTTFSYSDLTAKAGSGGEVTVNFKIRNRGRLSGAEVAEVYASLPKNAHEPPLRLVGWSRAELGPGETKDLRVTIKPKYLSVFDVQSESWKLLPGIYVLHIGGSSRDLPLATNVVLR